MKENAMTCFHPIPYEKIDGQMNFNVQKQSSTVQWLNCRQCSGCRYARLREWATRIYCELKMHNESCFCTFTYAPEHLPENQNLYLDDMTKFWKRLRKRFPNHQIRYFYAGEYGEKLKRPHYHAIIMGFDPLDKKSTGKRGAYQSFVSDTMNKLWGKGWVDIGEANINSIMYTAGYIQKKAMGPKHHYDLSTGKTLQQMYEWPDFLTGEIIEHKREYSLMSRRPGIGDAYVRKYHKDIYRDDHIVFPGGFKAKVPNYFDKVYKSMGTGQEKHLELIKEQRQKNILKFQESLPDNYLESKKAAFQEKMSRKAKRTYD